MIILHNQHDKDSREFVEKYGSGNTIIEYPECVEKYTYVSAFPSVIIDVPAYYYEFILEDTTSTTDITVIPNDTTTISEGVNIDAVQQVFRSINDPCNPDDFWKEIQDYILFVNNRAKENPPK